MGQRNQNVLDKDNPKLCSALDQLETLLDDAMQEQRLVGMSAAVVYDQEILWAKGFGHADLEREVQASEKTVYNIASVSKLFTATMLMMLRDAGALHLDEPLQKYLPEFSTRSDFCDPRPPTFRQVIAHIAGLPREPVGKMGEGWPPMAAFLASLQDTEMILPAYAEIKYSNLGLAVLGCALARIAGQPYQSYVVERILTPLGMTSSGWALSDSMRARLALGYTPLEDDRPRQIAPHYELGEAGAPTGGLYTTVEDLARFMSLQFRQGPAGGAQILGSTTLKEMRSPVFVQRDWSGGMGIGWYLGRVAGYPTIDHGGGQPGYVAKVQLVPELKLGLAVCVNQIANQHAITHNALELLIPVFSDMRSAAMARSLPTDADKLTGRYVEESGAVTIEVLIEGNELFVAQLHEGQNVGQWQIIPEQGYSFRMQGGPLSGELVRFERGPTGHATSIACGGYIFHPTQA
jgi:CubicO group peptidase (beta-lactamase class C family)